jgi:mRNA-degrading endonuclease toxin of MazEF toxin-antitoxin module
MTTNNMSKINNKGKQIRHKFDYSNYEFKRGEVFMANLGCENKVGSEQSGMRPIVILKVNKEETKITLSCACMSTKDKGRDDLYYHIPVDPHGTAEKSLVYCEHIRTVNISQLRGKLYDLSETEMKKVAKAVRKILNMNKSDKLDTVNHYNDAYERGAICNINITDLRPNRDTEWKPVPCVVIQNNIHNRNSTTMIVATISNVEDINKLGKITIDFISTIDKQKVGEYIRPAIELEMKNIEKSISKKLEI